MERTLSSRELMPAILFRDSRAAMTGTYKPTPDVNISMPMVAQKTFQSLAWDSMLRYLQIIYYLPAYLIFICKVMWVWLICLCTHAEQPWLAILLCKNYQVKNLG